MQCNKKIIKVYTFLFSLILTISSSLIAQDNLVAIGEWRSHLSYETAVAITESEDAVFFGSTKSILKVYKSDQSLEHLNTVSGLSDMGIKTIDYNRSENILVVAYNNGNIDLLHDNGRVVNLSAILTNNNIIGNKAINHIYNAGRKIYFSCAFGLVVYDLDLNAFSQTTFTNASVNACSQLNDTLFISTSTGIYSGVLDGRNLLDFSLWELQNAGEGLNIGAYSSKNLIKFQNRIYADVKDTLMEYKNGQWQHFAGRDNATNTTISFWRPFGNSDFVANYNMTLNYNGSKIVIATNSQKYYTVSPDNEIFTNNHPNSWRVKDIVIDQNNIVWAADQAHMHRNSVYIKPNAPYRDLVADMHVDNEGTLWVASSPYNTYSAYFNRDGVFRYKDGIWSMYNSTTYPRLDTFWDAIRVISNPENDKIYVGSFMSGLLEINPDNSINVYDQYTPNVPLSGTDGDPARTRVTGLAVDEDGNVWMSNSRSYSSMITVLKPNGTWKAFPSTKFNDYQIENIEIDRNGYKWIKQITGKITVFDSGDLNNDNDDRSFQVGDNNSLLPNINITAMKADKEGVIWVGTNEGLTIFNCSSNIFDGACQGNRPIISQDNFNGYLLEGEEILDIEVDGANRKWIATKSGLFLLSEDGYDQLAYFTKENSPLFDNEVTNLAMDGVTGTLYIASGVGIQSFRSDATTGLRKMKVDDIAVFPHPVEPGYDGPIAISNLADQANVKITDISGRLVYETTALGGQAIWYGTDYNGRRAQTGVYLVFIVNESGSQQAVGKILFSN